MRIDVTPQALLELGPDSPAFAGTVYTREKFALVVRRITEREQQKALRDTTSIVKGRQQLDTVEADAVLFVGAVVSWEGFSDQDGNPLACTEANRRAIATLLPDFRRCVLDAAVAPAICPEVEEAEEKN
jgi:uncharacterized linocin/CFP29 family protein